MAAPDSIWKMSLAGFREALAQQATPGCGAAAAAIAGFGLALVLKGLNISESREQDTRRIVLIEKAEILLGDLTALADRDIEAFEAYMDAVRLPKNTRKKAEQRRDTLRRAAASANEVPLESAQACLDGLALAATALALTAANLRSDVVAGGMLLHAGLSSVLVNVDTNLTSLDHESERGRVAELRDALQQDADQRIRWLTQQGAGKMAGPASG